MVNVDNKKRVLDFIKKHKIAVISTVNSQNTPEAAVVEFGETDNLELIFDTSTTYRKYKNIQKRSNVAFVIGWDDDITVQYEGKAKEVHGEELEQCKKAYFAKNPEAKRWEKDKDIVYFKVTPQWIRYSDLRKHPWGVFEVDF